MEPESVENPLRDPNAHAAPAVAPFEASDGVRRRKPERWVFCAKVPIDDEPDRPQGTDALRMPGGEVATTSGTRKRAAKKGGTSSPGEPPATDEVGRGLGGADFAEQVSDELVAANASLARARVRANQMEEKMASLRTQMASDLRAASHRAQEDAGALRECRNQLRDTDEELGKAQLNLWSEQSEKARLAKELAKMQGQLDAARMQSNAARESQVMLAKALNDSMENLDSEKEQEGAMEPTRGGSSASL